MIILLLANSGKMEMSSLFVFCVEMIIYYISEYYRVIIQYLDSNV